MFEQAFKNIDDVLWKEAGCTTELDYTEQASWLLFLKYLDGLEQDRADEVALDSRKYAYTLDKPYRWDTWAAPKCKDGKLDHNAASTGDDLRDFVNQKLFPYLHAFKQKATGPNTIEYKIGEIFGEIKNKITSGYNLREIIDQIDALRFRSQTEKHELSHLYEAKIKNMGNAGRNGGEYYTPRPLIRAIVEVVAPKIGETIYDGALGSAGFHCEAFDYLKRTNPNLTTTQDRILQERTFYGKEKKSLAYVIAIMNMILHGIEAPNIIHTNTLTENLADIQEKDRRDIVMANPPFGGKERKEVQQNFPIRTGETAFLFLQHFIKMLKAGGRGGIVIKNTFLSNTDNASVSLRKLLLESCNLHTVLDCPGGTFQGAGVKTVVLFFVKGAPTRKVWFYQLDPGRNLGKTNPLNDADLAEFVKLQKTFADSPKSWNLDATTIDSVTFDLSVKNQKGGEEIAHRSPEAIMDEIARLDAESAEVLGEHPGSAMKKGWETKTLDQISANLDSRRVPITKSVRVDGDYPYYGASGIVDYVAEYIFDEDTLLISEDGANLLARSTPIAFPATGKYWVNNHAHILKFDSLTTQRFVELYLESIPLDAYITGAAQPKLNQKALNSIPIPVPPLAEQLRIVNILDEAFAGLTIARVTAEKNLQNARALFESHLQSVLRNRKWEWKMLGDLCDDVEYGSSAKSDKEGEVPVLRMGNIQDGRLNWQNLVYSDDKAEIEKYLLKHNDVLFNRTNSPELVGKTAIYKSEMPAIFAGYLIRIHRKEEQLDADYLTYFLNSQIAFDYGKTVVISSVNQANINGTKLKSYPIPAPSLSEQKAIVNTLDALREETGRLASLYDRKLDALEGLKKSLLHQAFSGNL